MYLLIFHLKKKMPNNIEIINIFIELHRELKQIRTKINNKII